MLNAFGLLQKTGSAVTSKSKDFIDDGISAVTKHADSLDDGLRTGQNSETLLESSDHFMKNKPKTGNAESMVHQGDSFTVKSQKATIPLVPEKQWKLSEVFSEEQIKWIKSIEAQKKTIPLKNLTDDEIAALATKNYGTGAAVKGKQLHLVVGPPGSGKSSVLVDPLAKKHGAMVIDSDAIKPQIDGFQNGIGGDAVHPASSKAASQMLVKALNNGDNIVHPIIGRKEADLIRMIEVAKGKGYKVGLHLADVPPQVSAIRVVERAQRGASSGGVMQIVPPDYALNTVGDLPQRVFQSVKNRPGMVDEFSHFDTNVPWGEPPILIEKRALE